MGETIVFFQMYTTLASASTFPSAPYDLTRYLNATIEVLLMGILGTSPTATAQPFGSSDLITWTALASASTLVAGTVSTISLAQPPRYVRLVIVLGGTAPIATLWAKAVARTS